MRMMVMGELIKLSDARREKRETTLADASLADLFGEVGRRLAAQVAPSQTAADDLALLSAASVAEMLGIPKAAVYEAARRKEIGSVRASVGSRSGRAVRFTRRQVADFIAARSRSAG
jgi:excisionase family DNA binding protein